ncbi:PHP-associated [Alkalispirochaeta americana]|uniref:PHP-associated n=1 Tax=Alkalispirochaeta americana TaxID=159291 RepID=A0A1N6Q9M6_9SPIO|nr:PHP domain-containing protein [Alkalispirochaeta americana]SIQ13290.1 PHP-associated [Alkalispirochaeta americana]
MMKTILAGALFIPVLFVAFPFFFRAASGPAPTGSPAEGHPLYTVPLPEDLPPRDILLHNPYQEIDWSRATPHKANLHTHTRYSDGLYSPRRMIQEYQQRGYTILAITDHNHVTWPWPDPDHTSQENYPEMIRIMGNEISDVHHLGSYFTNYNIAGRRYRPIVGRLGQRRAEITIQDVLKQIGQRQGAAVLFHPGRYSHSLEWYYDLFLEYPHLLGLEIINRNNRYPQDRYLWDSLLSALMPERPLWGFASDDAHRLGHIGYAFSVFPLEEATPRTVRSAMERGAFYTSHTTTATSAPDITHIIHDPREGTVTIRSSEEDLSLRWISLGREVHRGETLPYRDIPGIDRYVRAELHRKRSDGITFTNPFPVSSRP